MKRLTYFILSITVLLLLFLFHFPPAMGFTSLAQTGVGSASPSDADEAETEVETEGENETEGETGGENETEGETGGENEAASIASIASPSVAAPLIIIHEIEVDKPSINGIHLLQRGDSSASLSLPQLDKKIYFYREGKDYAEKDVRFSVHYETDSFDQTYGRQTGLFFLKATIVLEDERYELDPDVSGDIRIPVFLYDPDRPACLPSLDPEHNQYDDMETFNIVAAVHTDLQQVTDMLMRDYPYQHFYLYFDDQYYLVLPNDWDMGSVNVDTPGVYPAYRRPKLPRGVLLKDIPEAACSINIQDSGVFTLSSPISFGNNIVIKWLYQTPDKSLFRIWYRIGKGDWTLDTEEYLTRLSLGGNGQYFLYLNPWEMEKDIHYLFRLEYDGVYSDILELCVNEDGFYIPNEGDRDGADRDDQTPPDVIQPPPKPSKNHGSGGGIGGTAETGSGPGSDTGVQDGYGPGYPDLTNQSSANIPASETEPGGSIRDDSVEAFSGKSGISGQAGISEQASVPLEQDTDTASTWSGTRILHYFKASPGLPLIFEKNQIRVAVSADAPALLTISDRDFLYVEIQALSTDTVRLAICLNDVPLTGIPLTITMPWTGDDRPETLQITNEEGELIGMADDVNADGSITFTVTQPGIYTVMPYISDETAASAAAEEMPVADGLSAESEAPAEPTARTAMAVLLTPNALIPAVIILGGAAVIMFRRYKRKGD